MIYYFVEKNQFFHFPTGVYRISADFTIQRGNRYTFCCSRWYAGCLYFDLFEIIFSYCWQLSQISLPFSKMGLIKEMYIVSGICCLRQILIFSWCLFLPQNSKWVWSENTTTTNHRQPRGNARKSRSTITRHQEDKLSKAISSLFPIKMIVILEWT